MQPSFLAICKLLENGGKRIFLTKLVSLQKDRDGFFWSQNVLPKRSKTSFFCYPFPSSAVNGGGQRRNVLDAFLSQWKINLQRVNFVRQLRQKDLFCKRWRNVVLHVLRRRRNVCCIHNREKLLFLSANIWVK